DDDLAEEMQKALVADGYGVDMATTADEAKQLVRAQPYDAIVLDWGLPDDNGINLCRQWRTDGMQSAVLFLTGKSRIENREAGLDAGADDYLIKPFQMQELKARLRALLRRSNRAFVDNILKFGPLELDAYAHSLTRAGVEIRLAGREYALLEFLMRN